jgi:uncharacterized iron-regulated membrane protein
MSTDVSQAASQPSSSAFYRAVWRWHFYAGLYVIPFLLMLAITGLIMVYGNTIESRLGKRYSVAPGGQRVSLEVQAKAAVNAVPDSKLTLFVRPNDETSANIFIVTANGKEHAVAVDPHTAKVFGEVIKDDTWYYWADYTHGSFFIGKASNGWGDHLIETAAGLGIILIVTGLYMWWPRGNKSFLGAFVPNLSRSGRGFWKELHITSGAYISILLLFFLISGLAWTGVWGGKIVQAWNTFPAEKWDNVPKSDQTHASMNHGALKEVPWALEQTPMPVSGSLAGAKGLAEGTPVNLDTVAAFARGYGFSEQFRINIPQDETGVYTVSADSMDADTTSPTGDHTVHIDQFTGKILADIRFADYPLGGKAMAVGIALHEATLGWWNLALNTVYCLLIILMCVSGVAMWWKRRPAHEFGSPLYPRDYSVPAGVIVLAGILCVLFPLSGVAIIGFAIIDFLLPKRLKEAGFQTKSA